MADILDVLNAMAETVAGTLYPNGVSNPSIVGAGCRIYPGWPIGQRLDEDLNSGQIVHVSLFPMRGSSSNVPQPLSNQVVAQAPVYGVTATIAGKTVTLSGAPLAGEFVTLVIDGVRVFSRGGDNVGDIATALLADLMSFYPGSTVSGGAIAIPTARSIDVRRGAPGKMVATVRRMGQQIMATVWAPTPELRASVGNAVATALINAYRIDLDDQSQARVTFTRMDDWDNRENARLYRRDLVFMAEYAITETYDAVEVTSFNGEIEIDDAFTKPLTQ